MRMDLAPQAPGGACCQRRRRPHGSCVDHHLALDSGDVAIAVPCARPVYAANAPGERTRPYKSAQSWASRASDATIAHAADFWSDSKSYMNADLEGVTTTRYEATHKQSVHGVVKYTGDNPIRDAKVCGGGSCSVIFAGMAMQKGLRVEVARKSMCGRIARTSPREAIPKACGVTRFAEIDWHPRYNVAPSQVVESLISVNGEKRLGHGRRLNRVSGRLRDTGKE